jgi:Flp pilus assembly pilin Flp
MTTPKQIAHALYHDDQGFIVSIELILLATVVVLGILTGISAVRDAVISELSDVAGAIQDLHQGYRINGVLGHSASTAGSDFVDFTDFCDTAEDANVAIDNCITINQTPIDEGAAVTAPTGR